MKISLPAIAVSLLSISSFTQGARVKRQNDILAMYNNLDISKLDGSWNLHGVTDNVWDLYESFSKTLGVEAGCIKLDTLKSNDTSFDAMASAMLQHPTDTKQALAMGAGAFYLQDPTAEVALDQNEQKWTAFVSQVYVNRNEWSDFTGQPTEPQEGSVPIPGSLPFTTTLYSKLIDSGAEVGSNQLNNIDAVFLWTDSINTIKQKRTNKKIYGFLFSRQPTLDENAYNNTINQLPPAIAENKISMVLIEDKCPVEDNGQQA
ncbi:hypothetical protein BDB01DRAFT_854565 [Pilobolus umbonatus]|nr:hypothetical protein BDB01DRAFT_854565 [Pilobolus umbonatus]